MTYHNDTTHISQSGLKLIERAPAHYWQRYLSPDKKEHDNQAFAIGRAFHRATTEPETFFQHYIVSPGKLDRRTKEGKQKWSEFEAAAQGRAILQAASPDTGTKQRDLDYDTVMRMSESARKHPLGARFIRSGMGKAEECHYWIDEETGVRCKAMTDWRAGGSVIIDLKSTDDASPQGVRRSIRKYGYDFQTAFYLDALFATTGVRHDFFFLFTEKKAPYLSAAYVLTPEDIQAARARYRDALITYRECLQTGMWPGYPQTIQTIEL